MQHRASMKNYHRMAAAEIFNHHNPEYHSKPRSRDRIDLHRLHVSEALEFVELFHEVRLEHSSPWCGKFYKQHLQTNAYTLRKTLGYPK